jgi:nucleoside-diphosphate-sugar epimerase
MMGRDPVTYLITGGCGFIGSYVARDLLEQGTKVIVYDFKIDQGVINQVISEEKLKDVVLIQGEITDLIHLISVVKSHKVSRIIHLASPLPPLTEENPPLAFDLMCKGTLNVLETARILDIEKVVWASSIAVYGPPEYHHGRIMNDSPQVPTHPSYIYGACKSFNEYLASLYADKYGVDTIGLRYTLVYGPGKMRFTKRTFATEMIQKVALGEPYEVPFGDATIDWQYIEDVSMVTVVASQAKRTRTRVFNTRGDLRPVKEAVDYLRSLAPGVKLTIQPGVFDMPVDFDTTVLEKEVGFKPKYSMEKGILKTLNTFRRQAGLGEIKR